jgi:hypothetical protein
MVLMDVPDLDTFLTAAYHIVRPGGMFVFSVTHPWFWPRYYGYESEAWFNYNAEIFIESPFRISMQPDCGLVSTHVHRSLEAYVRALLSARFSIEMLREPMPSTEVAALYPMPWFYPRYLVGSARRSGV